MLRTPHPLLRTIGITIRSLRRTRGLSQESLADLARIDRSYMSSIERGHRNVSVLNISRIAIALGVPMRDLLDSPAARAALLAAPLTSQDPMLGEVGIDARPPAFGRRVDLEWEPGRYLSLS